MENPPTSMLDPDGEIVVLERALRETRRRLRELGVNEADEAQSGETVQRDMAGTQLGILDALPAHIALLDEHGVIIFVNETWRRFATDNLLHAPGYGLGQNYLHVCDGASGDDSDVANAVARGIRRVLCGEVKEFAIEYPCHSPQEKRWFRLMVTPQRGGGRSGAVVMQINITERKLAERGAGLLSAIVKSSSDAIISKDLHGIVTSWNAAAEKIFGYTAEEMIGHSITRLIPWDRKNEEEQILARIRLGECVEHFETVRVRKDGELVDVSVTVSPVNDDTGEIVGASKVARDISGAKRAEAALRESQEALHLTLDAANIGYWDLDLVTRQANRSVQHDRIFGYQELLPVWTYEQFLGHVIPEDRERIDGLFHAGLVETKSWDFECRILRTDGVERWIWAHGNVYANAAGEPVQMLGMVSDITGRKEAEAALRESDQRLRFTLESCNIGAWDMDLVNHTAYRSVEHARIFGYAEALPQWTFDDFLRHVLPEYRVEVEALVRDATAAQCGWAYECPIRRMDGEIRWIWFSGSFRTDLAGHGRVAGIVMDITERINAEVALREKDALLHAADRRLAEIVHGMTEACFALDTEWRFSFVNDRGETLLRHRREEMIGQSIWEVFHALVGTPMEAQYRRAMTERVPVSFEVFSPVADRWLDIRLFPTGEGLAAFLLDVHVRKLGEEALRETQARLNSTLAAGSVGTWTWDIPNDCLVADEFTARVFSIAVDAAAKGLPAEAYLRAVLEEDQPGVAESLARAIETCGYYDIEYRVRQRDGELLWLQAKGRVEGDAEGNAVNFHGAVMDITERKRAEEKIHQLNTELEQRVIERTKQLEAANKELEAFSYSVSHDLRAPLRAVDGFSQAVLEDYGPLLPEEGTRYLLTIRDGAQRMGHLIDDLLTFSRLSRMPLARKSVDTRRLVREALGELEAEKIGRRIEIRIGELPVCQGDPALLKQVWLNLLSNALKYSRQREQAVIEIGSMGEAGTTAYFVRDNGTGFDMRYAGKLFGVFQRLHRQEEFEGTGVGLALVQRIVHRHGGRVWAEAAVDRGATFYFTLEGETQS